MKINYRRSNPAPHRKPPHKFTFNARYSEKFIDGTALSTGIIGHDFTCGQHGAARAKKGAKHAITTARRRAHKRFIQSFIVDVAIL